MNAARGEFALRGVFRPHPEVRGPEPAEGRSLEGAKDAPQDEAEFCGGARQ